ncbi:MAG: HypC/HybG/HupF family hydrogenase formation chaperone [Anaerolineales bacterium]|nr:HypC/HybG/HupF family hydrogenase formation chaperone [Anaerolineales bacterium]
MCLGIPGQILNVRDEGLFTRTGQVSFGGIVKQINLSYTPEAEAGDYVIVHVGFAITMIDAQEARRVFEYLEQINELEDIQS